MVGRITALQRCPCLIPRTYECVTLQGKGTWQVQLWLRTVRWVIMPGYPHESWKVEEAVCRVGQRCSIRCCCWLWRCKKIAMSQRMWRLLEGGNDPQVRANKRMETLVQNCKELNSAKNTNKHKMNPPLHPPERARACQHLDFFSFETPTALLTYRIIDLCCLKPQSCGNLLQQR